MSGFRDAVNKMIRQEAYFLVGNDVVKATITDIVDDLVLLKLSNPGSYTELIIHIDHLIPIKS